MNGSPARGYWIALSHCWGGIVEYVTTKKTLGTRHRGMPLDELPATFRDAVLITRSLGVQYLWIDALCIVQDSKDDDWPKEASRMRHYYLNSVLTIAAMNAENSKKGFLQKRIPRFEPINLLLKSDIIGWEGNVYIRETHPRSGLFQQAVVPSTLVTRGWTFQETCLPPRTLNFTTSGLVFECLTHEVREWLHDPITPGSELKLLIRPSSEEGHVTMQLDAGVGENQFKCDRPAVRASATSMYESWEQVVFYYSERSLTYPSDKLPAMSGVASFFSSQLPGDKYLAGLWESRLLEELCWHISNFDKVPSSRPLEYRAPSWSWASIDGQIILSHADSSQQNEDNDHEQAKVMEVYVKHDPNDPFGRALGGQLRLHGLWLLVYLDVFPEWDDEEGPGTFHFVLEESDRTETHARSDPLWVGHVQTKWLDILDPSHYSVFNSGCQSPIASSIPGQTELSDTPCSDEKPEGYEWEGEVSSWTCIPFARLDVPPTSKEFFDNTGRFCMGVLKLSDTHFLLLQPSDCFPGTFRRIGIASASWVRGRRFSEGFIKRNSHEIVIT